MIKLFGISAGARLWDIVGTDPGVEDAGLGLRIAKDVGLSCNLFFTHVHVHIYIYHIYVYIVSLLRIRYLA